MSDSLVVKSVYLSYIPVGMITSHEMRPLEALAFGHFESCVNEFSLAVRGTRLHIACRGATGAYTESRRLIQDRVQS